MNLVDYTYKKENEDLRRILYIIRNKLKRHIITLDLAGNYCPAKNSSKQEVYKTFVEIREMLKANYPFKEDKVAIDELLKDINSLK